MEYIIYDEKITAFVESQRSNVCEDIVDQLTNLRKKCNMTQQDIANITGIKRPNIARIENCNATPTIDVLIKYAAALGYKLNISLVEIEDQRAGRNKDTVIDENYINSGAYRRKFDLITNDSDLNRLLYQKAKEMLIHRSGTEFEDMYWFDMDMGEILCSKLNETNLQEIRHTKSIAKKLQNRENVIGMHTHPHSMPPSAADFNAFVQAGYRMGIVICHDGTIYIYSAQKEISEELLAHYINMEYRKCYDEKIAQERALSKIIMTGDIMCKEVKL